jgi:SAM-dependent methyltransferase
MPTSPPYRDFYFPLNVFMHILTLEEGGVEALHYGFFRQPGDTIVDAQKRSTAMLLERLPAPPARILEVGIGLAGTLAILSRLGYDATGITPDARQIEMVQARYGQSLHVECVRFEDFETAANAFDAIVLQESSQYIDAQAIFVRSKELLKAGGRVLVLDEFALKDVKFEGALHSRDHFVATAERLGFACVEEVDVSDEVWPTIDYFIARFPRYRQPLIDDLGLTSAQVDELIDGGVKYRDLYRAGTYGYRVLVFEQKEERQ